MTRRRLTEPWIRMFIHAHKLSSYQDKIHAMRSESNPYYLLEWLIIERIDGDEAFWSQWEGERTPGLERGGQVGIEECFRDQLLWEMLLGSPPDEEISAQMETALSDLEEYYGAERWKPGLQALQKRLEEAVSRYQRCEAELQAKWAEWEKQWEKTQQQLKEEAEQYDEGSFDLEAELRKARASWNQRKQDLPRKWLQEMYPNDGLLRYLFLSGLPNPQQRLRLRIAELTRGNPAARQWREALKKQDFEQLEELRQTAKLPRWFSSYISQNSLARSVVPTKERQRQALRWVTQLPHDAQEEWIAAVFRASGWEERLAEPEFVDERETLHRFVWAALPQEAWRQRLRDVVLLHWSEFAERFSATDAVHFTLLSWVLLLDPENIQQRFLRPGASEISGEEWIEKLCMLYSEAIRRGLDVQIIVSLFAYLAKHDRETFYSFVHGIQSLPDALPILRLNSSTLSLLFGRGVRQQAARQHLLQLYLAYMDEPPPERSRRLPKEALQKLSDILTLEKREAVLGWLERHERDWRKWMGSAQMRSFTRLLRIRWIGTAADETEQHKMVKEWLERHSDWVVFETDIPYVEQEGISYKIIKPGAIDAETGELLIRAVVRAEWSDSKEIHRLLDDLRSL